jgi:hypothetical protein
MLAWAGLYTETRFTRQHPWRAEVSRKAVRLDPKFALPGRSCQMLIHTVTSQRIFSRQSPSVRHGRRETALTLQPKPVRQYGPRALSLRLPKDYDTAARCFEQARPLLPNSSRIPESLAYLERRSQWGQSENYFNEAEQPIAQRSPPHPTRPILHDLSSVSRSAAGLTRFSTSPGRPGYARLQGSYVPSEGDLPRAAALLARCTRTDQTLALEIQVYQAILSAGRHQ